MSKKYRIHRLSVKTDSYSLQVESYKYIGNIISYNGKSTMEVKSKIAQEESAFTNKRNLLYSKNLTLNIKKQLIKVYVWSVALYERE